MPWAALVSRVGGRRSAGPLDGRGGVRVSEWSLVPEAFLQPLGYGIRDGGL